MHFHQSLEEAAVTQAEPQNRLEITPLMKAILWEELGSMFVFLWWLTLGSRVKISLFLWISFFSTWVCLKANKYTLNELKFNIFWRLVTSGCFEGGENFLFDLLKYLSFFYCLFLRLFTLHILERRIHACLLRRELLFLADIFVLILPSD